MKPSLVTDLLYERLNLAGQRQKIIASNIANINTPNYKTKDLSFEEELKKSSLSHDLKLKVTNRKHISSNQNQNQSNKFNIFEVKHLQEQNDGNNVNLDQQMSQMAQNSVIFDALQKSIKKDSSWMKEVIISSSKN